jgi:ribose-phosphate pyrophosphokinase
MKHDTLKVFAGNANLPLAQEICDALEMPLADVQVKHFSDGEIYIQVQENVRGADVFVIQPTCTPVDRNLMELLLMIDALKRASAERITAVLPYYGYARQDRKDKPRVPISARLVAAILETAGASRVLALDLHAAQIGVLRYFGGPPVRHAGDDRYFRSRIFRPDSVSPVVWVGAGVCGAVELAAGDYR